MAEDNGQISVRTGDPELVRRFNSLVKLRGAKAKAVLTEMMRAYVDAEQQDAPATPQRTSSELDLQLSSAADRKLVRKLIAIIRENDPIRLPTIRALAASYELEEQDAGEKATGKRRKHQRAV